MKSAVLFLAVMVAQVTFLLTAEDIRSKTSVRTRSLENSLIDPDKKAYGVPFGASESDFIKVHGKPNGYITLTTNSVALMYGRDTGFIFRNGKLQAVRVTGSILDWKLINDYSDWSYSGKDWRLNNGVRSGMNLQEVRTILGTNLVAENNSIYRQYFTTTNARVELGFSHWSNEGAGESAYRMHSIYVEHGSATALKAFRVRKPKGLVPQFSADPTVRSFVNSVNQMASAFTRMEIDPDGEIYEVPLGATEEDFIKKHGAPTGYVRLGEKASAMIYGQSHAFLFLDGKLAGARISDNILDWELANELNDTTIFSTREWRLSNGIELGTDAQKVKKILGDKLMQENSDRYHRYFLSEKSRVELDFAHYSSEGEGENAYKVHSIAVWPISAGKQEDRIKRLLLSAGRDGSNGTSYGGIGAMMSLNKNKQVEIVSVFSDSSAAKAGLKKGMVIRAVDDVSTEGKGVSAVTGLVRGREGTKVKLDIFDPEKNSSSTVELVRMKIVDRSTGNTMITTDKVLRMEDGDGAVALIQFFGFTMDTDKGEDTATYRWRFKPSPSSPMETGTNTKVFRYTRTKTGANTFEIMAKDNPSSKPISVGTFRLNWSYGYTNRGYIYPVNTSDKVSVVDAAQFETGP